jgi:transposase, IS5 family
VIGAVIIKHKLNLSDVETVQQIQENPYHQYFVGLPGYQQDEPFAASLFVEIRKRMGAAVFEAFHRAVIEAHDGKKKKSPSEPSSQTPPSDPLNADSAPPGESADQPVEPTHQGKLILDATVVEQAIRYPTDLSLLNEAREFSEQIIDTLCASQTIVKKPRTYREKARQAYLAIAKQKRPGGKKLRRGIKQQLQYLRRNLGHIEQLLIAFPEGKPLPLPGWLLHRYWVIQHLFQQQWEMYHSQARRCDDRIVSISQPYVRPIVRGKLNKPVEFGAKLSVSLTGDGFAQVDHLRWDAFHEGLDLASQVESYRDRYGYYPERVLADPLYGTRANRDYLKQRGIHFAGKPLGRPKQVTDENRGQLIQLKVQRRQDYLQRIPIEGKFGQGKNGYRLNYIRAKRANTSFAWINSIFLVMNLMILQRIFFVLSKTGITGLFALWKRTWKRLRVNYRLNFFLPTAGLSNYACRFTEQTLISSAIATKTKECANIR